MPTSLSDFHRIVKDKYIFADKTNLINDIMEDGATNILITRPHGWGKSLGLSMLQNFLANHDSRPQNDDTDIFRGLKISDNDSFCLRHKYQYPVIHVSFENVTETNYNEAEGGVFLAVQNSYKQHGYLLDTLKGSEKTDFKNILNLRATITKLKRSILSLSKYLRERTDKPVVLLVDDYDTPFQTAYLNGYFSQMENLMGAILVSCLKDNRHIRKAVVTGVNVIAREADLINFNVYSVLNDRRYFGFTEADVNQLINKTGMACHKNELVKWHGVCSSNAECSYSPYSVLEFLRNGRPGLCRDTAVDGLIKELVRRTGMNFKGVLVYLFKGQSTDGLVYDQLLFPSVRNHEESFWTLLVHAGFLNAVFKHSVYYKRIYSLSIPNEQMNITLANICNAVFSLDKLSREFGDFREDVMNVDVKKVEGFIGRGLLESGSFYDFDKNSSVLAYHSYMLGLLTPLKEYYVIKSNLNGRGRYDLALVPDMCAECTGILFKFHANGRGIADSAEDALRRIVEKSCVTEFRGKGYKRFVGIGVSFFLRSVSMCSVELPLR